MSINTSPIYSEPKTTERLAKPQSAKSITKCAAKIAAIALPLIATTILIPFAIAIDFGKALKKPREYEPNITAYTECAVSVGVRLVEWAKK
jgi:hypothetical protein